MASSSTPRSRLSALMERTSQWIFSQDLPSDIVVQVGKVDFQLHKFMLVAKSGLIRRKVIESKRADLGRRIDLSEVPGGAAAFEKAAMFCYGVSFEISVNSVAAVRCAAEYLQMTEDYCRGNLVQRTEEFINQIALKTLPGAVALLRSCDDAPDLLRPGEHVRIVQRSVDVISLKACNEANFPTRSPADWWAAELALLFPTSFKKILTGMKSRGAAPKSLAVAIVTYAEKSLPNLLLSEGAARPFVTGSDAARARQRCLLDSLVSILPPDRDAPLPVGFIYRLLRAAVFLGASEACRRELERRASASLDQAAVANLLTISLDYSGERVVDLDSARRIVASFAEREASASAGGGVLYGSGFKGVCSSPAVHKAARTVDSFLGEIATDKELSVSKFAGIAGALPKSARRFDDDLYRAVDIYLKAHPSLDEIEREKVCSVMDPLKLSYEARLHASQNRRLPLQIVLHALYYDQLQLQGGEEARMPAWGRDQGLTADDMSLIRENENLRLELARMKIYVSQIQQQGMSGLKMESKNSFFSSVSRTLGKLNPFKQVGSKDTSSIENREVIGMEMMAKPRRRRRFSIA
ncbi:hypothetical protein ZIOFF_049137 [Zingiber officinale]|uniref:NPH3 domain-containing protein n=1 Tax=Zingiber officinale TaxID=94328 RepID=A0A8J5KXB6_ZINOF|nr:hypothetical protein ZIOFF_049137 [Zingiber officinale]